MTTREKLVEYRRLKGVGPEQAEKFFKENSSDERFVSIVKLGARVVKEVRAYMDTYEKMVGPINEITDPETFIEGLGELIRNMKSENNPNSS